MAEASSSTPFTARTREVSKLLAMLGTVAVAGEAGGEAGLPLSPRFRLVLPNAAAAMLPPVQNQ